MGDDGLLSEDDICALKSELRSEILACRSASMRPRSTDREASTRSTGSMGSLRMRMRELRAALMSLSERGNPISTWSRTFW